MKDARRRSFETIALSVCETKKRHQGMQSERVNSIRKRIKQISIEEEEEDSNWIRERERETSGEKIVAKK